MPLDTYKKSFKNRNNWADPTRVAAALDIHNQMESSHRQEQQEENEEEEETNIDDNN